MASTVVFDYDGTLHDSMHIYRTALQCGYQLLVDRGQAPAWRIPEQVMAANIGLVAREAWSIMCPDIPWSIACDAAKRVGEVMDELIEDGSARIFPGVFEMLQAVKDAGHTLVFLSNCRDAYCDVSRKAFGLDRWFSGYYTAEKFSGAPKEQIFESIRKDYPGPYIIVGDRDKDRMLAQAHGLAFIGCTYGYAKAAELQGATALADAPKDIAPLVQRIDYRLHYASSMADEKG